MSAANENLLSSATQSARLEVAEDRPDHDTGPGPALYDLRLLESFVALSHELHFGRAAERLSFAQPALSQQIRRLETQLGLPLFTRDSRRVELTPAGTAFARYAQRSLTLAIEAREAAIIAGRDPWGRLALSGSIDAIPYAHDVLRAFTAEHRRTQLELVLQSHTATVASMARHASDAAIVWSDDRPPQDFEATATLLANPGGGVALSAKHPLASLPQISRDDLRGQRLLMFPRDQNPGMYDRLVERLGGAEAFERIDTVTPLRPGVFKDVVEALDDTAIAPSPVWHHDYTGPPGVVFRPLTSGVPVAVWLIWTGPATQPTQALADFAARAANGLAAT